MQAPSQSNHSAEELILIRCGCSPWTDGSFLKCISNMLMLRGRVMKKTSILILRNSFLFFSTLFTISSVPATAQTQTKLAAPRITQAIDEAKLVTLQHGVNPLALAGFDQGVVADFAR